MCKKTRYQLPETLQLGSIRLWPRRRARAPSRLPQAEFQDDGFRAQLCSHFLACPSLESILPPRKKVPVVIPNCWWAILLFFIIIYRQLIYSKRQPCGITQLCQSLNILRTAFFKTRFSSPNSKKVISLFMWWLTLTKSIFYCAIRHISRLLHLDAHFYGLPQVWVFESCCNSLLKERNIFTIKCFKIRMTVSRSSS